MKKLLTILILLLTVASQGWAAIVETTLWESTYTGEIELNSEKVATFKAGDVLRVYVTVPGGGANFKIVYKGAPDWSETTIPSIANQWPWVNGGETYKDFTLTADDIPALSGQNIYLYNSKDNNDNFISTITKVSIIKSMSIDFSNLATGDLIRIIHSAGDGSKTLSVKTGETSLYNAAPAADATTTVIEVTEGNVGAIKTNGIQVESALTVSEIQSESPANSTIWRYFFSSFNTKTVTTANFASLNNIEIGNRLTVTINKSDDVSLAGTFNNGSDDINVCDISNWEGSKDIVVTSANIDYIKSNGLTFTGSNVDYVKVEINTWENTGTISESGFSRLWSSTADSGNPKQVTFSETYGVAGWEIGDTKYNDATSITVNLAETPSQTIKMVLEYANLNGKVLETETTFSEASATINVPQTDLLKLRCLYLKSPDAITTITLGTIRILTPALIDASTCVYEVANTVVSSALVGDKIKITYSSITSGDMTLKVGTTDGGEDVLASGTVTGISKEIVITASTLAAIKSNGLYLRGNNITISNVELVAVPPFTGDDNSKTANLAKFVEDDGASYDGNGTITTTAGYKGVKLTLSEGQYVSGTRLIVNFQSATNAKVHVNYVGKSWGDGSENTGNGTQLIVPLNISNQVSEVIIQIATAGTATLTGVSVDNKCMLTTTAVMVVLV